MRYLKNTIFAGLFILATACSSSSDSGAEESNVATSKGASEASQSTGDTFSLDGKAACEVVPVETIAKLFNVPAGSITSESYRDKEDHKLCRYELRYAEDKIASLFINARYNDRQDVRPNQYSDEFKKALKEGLPVDGFKDKIQTFEEVNGLGTQAAYSGNLSDNKNLIVRIGEDYFIRLEYSRYENGNDIGDYQSELTQLAKTLLQ